MNWESKDKFVETIFGITKGSILGIGGYLIFKSIKTNFWRNMLLGLLVGTFSFNQMIGPQFSLYD
jgi:hypothetical protein